MGFLDETGLGIFLQKLKAVVGQQNGIAPLDGSGAVPSRNLPVVSAPSQDEPGEKGAAPAPSPGDEVKFLRGDGTWANLPIVYNESEDGPANPVEGMIWLKPKV